MQPLGRTYWRHLTRRSAVRPGEHAAPIPYPSLSSSHLIPLTYCLTLPITNLPHSFHHPPVSLFPSLTCLTLPIANLPHSPYHPLPIISFPSSTSSHPLTSLISPQSLQLHSFTHFPSLTSLLSPHFPSSIHTPYPPLPLHPLSLIFFPSFTYFLLFVLFTQFPSTSTSFTFLYLRPLHLPFTCSVSPSRHLPSNSFTHSSHSSTSPAIPALPSEPH